MKKFVVIMVLGLALLLMGLTLSASALTINPGASGEQSLYQVFNTILGNNALANNAALIAAYPTIFSTLSTDAGGGATWTYAVTGVFYTGAGYTQDPGTNAAGVAIPVTAVPSALFPTSGNQYVTIGNVAITPVTTGGSFGFADVLGGSGSGIKYTELALNNPQGAQSNGLIFQVSSTQFIVAFEDGGGTLFDPYNCSGLKALGDVDYNDLVINITRTFHPVPLPPSALLLGSGLLGLVGLRRWRKNA